MNINNYDYSLNKHHKSYNHPQNIYRGTHRPAILLKRLFILGFINNFGHNNKIFKVSKI